jgi:hypothetical protein
VAPNAPLQPTRPHLSPSYYTGVAVCYPAIGRAGRLSGRTLGRTMTRARLSTSFGVLGAAVALVLTSVGIFHVEQNNAAVIGRHEWPDPSVLGQFVVYVLVSVAAGFLGGFVVGWVIAVITHVRPN